MISQEDIAWMRTARPLVPLMLPFLAILLITAAPGPPALAAPADADTSAGADRTSGGRNGWIFFPYIFYTPETRMGIGGGGGYFFRNPCSCDESRPSTVLGNIIYTQNKQLVLAVQPDIYWRDEKYYLRTELSYQKFPDKFFGIGNRTSSDVEEDFTPEEVRINLGLQVRLLSGLSAGPLYEYFDGTLAKVETGGLLDQGTIPGSGGARVSGAGLQVSWDTRDNLYLPSTGSHYQLSAVWFGSALGSRYDFRRIVVDLRQYVPVWFSHVLAFQIYGRSTSGEVPFQQLSRLGGSLLMRGYYEGRYRDHDLIVVQSEYRMPLWRRFGGVVFAGLGDVAGEMSRFRSREVKTSAGFGLRYMLIPEEKMNLRLDFGFGKDTSGFYVTITEAF
jgi:outer membrane protein assembly factor BamA